MQAAIKARFALGLAAVWLIYASVCVTVWEMPLLMVIGAPLLLPVGIEIFAWYTARETDSLG